MRFFILITFIFLFSSCKKIRNYNNDKSPNKYKKDSLDLTKLDAYPLLPECDSLSDRHLQKQCFYNKISLRIQNSLIDHSFKTNNNLTGKIFVKINIDNKGKSQVKDIIMPIEINNSLPYLDSLIHQTIKDLPLVKPAVKMGIPVKCEFILPIQINNFID